MYCARCNGCDIYPKIGVHLFNFEYCFATTQMIDPRMMKIILIFQEKNLPYPLKKP